jgi:2'-5' RNA ligase
VATPSQRPLRDSSLFIPVPEAEDLVAPLRSQYDRTAPVGFPAHITLLYPFLPAAEIDGSVEADLRDVFSSVAPFSFTLGGVCGFRGLVWLTPEPREPYLELTAELRRRYPHLSPYGNPDRGIVAPHLTVARSPDLQFLVHVSRTLAAALPIAAVARDVWLLAEGAPRWTVHSAYRLGEQSKLTTQNSPSMSRKVREPAPRRESP